MSTRMSSALDPDLETAVAEQLERVLADDRFLASQRSSRFLRYVVERTLEGRADEIKELVIAVELYARADGYDPKADSTVRVEASRLRGKLHRYYEERGRRDPIRITIPKGSYVPQFERLPQTETPTAAIGDLSDARLATAGVLPEPRRARLLLGPWTLVLLACIAMASAWRPYAIATAREAVSVPGREIHPEALAAWQEGNELLRQDPHTGSSGRGIPRTLERAIERYELTVARAPVFARGWASLAEAYEYASAFVGRDHAEDVQRAEQAARRAVALDPNLPEGHAMLALVLFYLKWDFAAAETEYRRAIELDPRAAWTIVEYVDLLRETGRLEQAASEIRRARVLQPAIPVLAVKQAEILLEQKRPDEAIATATAAMELKHDSERAHVVLGMALEAKGASDEALIRYRQALQMNASDRRALPALGYLLGRMGHIDEARETLRRLLDLNERVRTCAYQIAVVHVGLGEHERALDWLERAFARHQMHVPFMVVDSRLDSLRSSPRFQAIVARLGLAGRATDRRG